MDNVIIMGATSGLGRRLAMQYISAGWRVGLAGRNIDRLLELRQLAPDRIFIERIDITAPDAPGLLLNLVNTLGGMSLYVHCSGILRDEDNLKVQSQLDVVETNVKGFAAMLSTVYNYFSDQSAISDERSARFQIAAISSIAGIRGLSQLPAYSASKAFDIHYLEALRQRAHEQRLPVAITDIRPGWTRTPLLSGGRRYMLEMEETDVARRIFKAIQKKRNNVVVGKRWQILAFAERLLPQFIWTRLHLPLWRNK